jgi:hypothetical protein
MLVIPTYIQYMKVPRGIFKYQEYCGIDLTGVIWYPELQ